MKPILIALTLLGTAAHAEGLDASLWAPIKAYETAINSGDLAGVMDQFTAGPVLMAQNNAPAVGHAAVQATYEGLISTLDLDIDFSFDESFQTGPNHAIVRTQSSGEITIKGDAPVTIPNANQELFVLEREDGGSWQIARYIFATTLPAQ